MRTISVAVRPEDYEFFRRSARKRKMPIAQLIREAMALYRLEKLEEKPRLAELPVLIGHRPLSPLPGRPEVYDEVFADATVAEP
jgi:hypothetical protein